jgi:hypothetical protein
VLLLECLFLFRYPLSPETFGYNLVFGSKRGEVTIAWRKLHNEELHNFYSSLDFVRVIKSRRMRCAGDVAARRDEMQNFSQNILNN